MDRTLLKTNAKQQLGGSIFAENWLLGLVSFLIFSTMLGMASSVLLGIFGLFGSGSFIKTMMELSNSVMTDPESLPPDYMIGLMNKTILPLYGGALCAGLIANVLITGPFTYGLCKTFYDLVMGGERVKLDTVFSGFRKYGETVLLGFMVSLFTALWSLLFIVPGIVKAFAYSMSYYVKAEHPEYTWRQCMDQSQSLMRGYKGRYFVLQLSFIGWYIVGSLAFGIGVLWVYPYHECTNANFYAWLTAQKRTEIFE